MEYSVKDLLGCPEDDYVVPDSNTMRLSSSPPSVSQKKPDEAKPFPYQSNVQTLISQLLEIQETVKSSPQTH